MKKKIILYCGEFDPPHIGHLYTAILSLNFMKNEYGFEKLIFVPVKTDIFGISCVASIAHIRAMLSIMIAPFGPDRFEVANFEINLNNSQDILSKVEDLNDRYNPVVLIEIDQAQYINKRRDYVHLAEKVRFVVANKQDYVEDPKNNLLKEPNIFIKKFCYESSVSPYSIRNSTHKDEFLDNNILKYITEKDLYLRNKGVLQ